MSSGAVPGVEWKKASVLLMAAGGAERTSRRGVTFKFSTALAAATAYRRPLVRRRGARSADLTRSGPERSQTILGMAAPSYARAKTLKTPAPHAQPRYVGFDTRPQNGPSG